MGPPPADRGEGWFTETYTAHYPYVVRYGLRRLADLDAAAELAQDVFVVAWRRRTQVPEHSLPWLYGVARRLLANRRRAAPAPVSMADPDLLHDHRMSDPDTAVTVAEVRTALATLGELDQEILRLVGWEELTVAEAAAALGCSRTAAAVRLHRARRRLVAAMADTPTPTPLWKET